MEGRWGRCGRRGELGNGVDGNARTSNTNKGIFHHRKSSCLRVIIHNWASSFSCGFLVSIRQNPSIDFTCTRSRASLALTNTTGQAISLQVLIRHRAHWVSMTQASARTCSFNQRLTPHDSSVILGPYYGGYGNLSTKQHMSPGGWLCSN